jgi:hypothetical protein
MITILAFDLDTWSPSSMPPGDRGLFFHCNKKEKALHMFTGHTAFLHTKIFCKEKEKLFIVAGFIF